MSHSVLDLFDPYFEKADNGSRPRPGDMYWVPVGEVNEVPRILDVVRADPTEHLVTEFAVREIDPKVHFRERERLPIKKLSLGSTEEMLLTKGKVRRCVVLFGASLPAAELDGLTAQQQRMAKHLTRDCYVLAPAYSISTPQTPNAYSKELVERTLALRYPHLSCIPDWTDKQPRSIVRFDHMFPSALGRGSSYSGFRVTAEALQILLWQVAILAGQPVPEGFSLIQEMLNT